MRYIRGELDWLEVEYNGLQEQTDGFSLEAFTDLQTGSTFLRLPTESIQAARDRIRRGFENVSGLHLVKGGGEKE